LASFALDSDLKSEATIGQTPDGAQTVKCGIVPIDRAAVECRGLLSAARPLPIRLTSEDVRPGTAWDSWREIA
jgi:hypothetical protein